MQDIQMTNLIEVLSTGRFHKKKKKFIIKQLIKPIIINYFLTIFQLSLSNIFIKFNKN